MNRTIIELRNAFNAVINNLELTEAQMSRIDTLNEPAYKEMIELFEEDDYFELLELAGDYNHFVKLSIFEQTFLIITAAHLNGRESFNIFCLTLKIATLIPSEENHV